MEPKRKLPSARTMLYKLLDEKMNIEIQRCYDEKAADIDAALFAEAVLLPEYADLAENYEAGQRCFVAIQDLLASAPAWLQQHYQYYRDAKLRTLPELAHSLLAYSVRQRICKAITAPYDVQLYHIKAKYDKLILRIGTARSPESLAAIATELGVEV